jgi:hypothetical protein
MPLTSFKDLYILCVHDKIVFCNDNISALNVCRRSRIIPVPIPNEISCVNVTAYSSNFDSNMFNAKSASIVTESVVY